MKRSINFFKDLSMKSRRIFLHVKDFFRKGGFY